VNSGASFDDRPKIRFGSEIFPNSQKSRAVSEVVPQFSHPRRLGADLPRTRLWVGREVFLLGEPTCEFFEDTLPLALAGGFTAELAVEQRLNANRQEDAHHLHLKRLAERVKLSDRPQERISAARSMPIKCSIFSAVAKCRQPDGRAATLGK